MFDIGWSELLVIGSIALIVVGPKDLPALLRTLGKYAAQARGMSREFQRSMEEAAREADISSVKELREAGEELNKLKRMRFDQAASSWTKSSAAPKAGAAGAAATAGKAADAAAAAKPDARPDPAPSADAPAASAPPPDRKPAPADQSGSA